MTVKNDSDEDLDDIDDDGTDNDIDVDDYMEKLSRKESAQAKQQVARRRIEEIREEQRLKREMEDFMDWE